MLGFPLCQVNSLRSEIHFLNLETSEAGGGGALQALAPAELGECIRGAGLAGAFREGLLLGTLCLHRPESPGQQRHPTCSCLRQHLADYLALTGGASLRQAHQGGSCPATPAGAVSGPGRPVEVEQTVWERPSGSWPSQSWLTRQ